MATASISYLLPSSSPAPIYGDALDDVFQINIAGITGITDTTLIRPRWQPEPPNQPDFSTNWVAFGVQVVDGDRFSYRKHDPTGNGGLGSDLLEKDETLQLLISFYGPNGTAICKQYQDGLQIDRNRDDLIVYGIKLVEVQEARVLPALLKEKWVRRIDISATFRRRIKRSYSIPTVVGDSVNLDNEQYQTPIVIPPLP